MKTVQIIVNADDLGESPKVNEAIFDLLDRGLATSATIIGNAPFVEEACRRVNQYPQCSFGAHMNVTQFRPLSGPKNLGPLLDGDGQFIQNKIREVRIDSSLAAGILEEFSAQIENLGRFGVDISHIDSHNYVFSIPRMFPVMKRLQKRFNIRKARISRNLFADGLVGKRGLTAFGLGIDPESAARDGTTSLRVKKVLYNFLLRHYYRTKTTQAFSGFRLFYENAKSSKMKYPTKVEVCVHPGSDYYDPSEIEILQGPWREELGFPIRLISYDDIK